MINMGNKIIKNVSSNVILNKLFHYKKVWFKDLFKKEIFRY